jgi:hypothetical protein
MSLVIWVDIPVNDPRQPFKSIGDRFAIWHEMERANHFGIHQFYTGGGSGKNVHVVLVNVKQAKTDVMALRKDARTFRAADF